MLFEAGFSELGIGVEGDRGVHVPVCSVSSGSSLFSPPIVALQAAN
jgi:hypothetical protein